MSRVNRASHIIVDPQELTEFLRYSKDITEFSDLTLNGEDGKVKKEVGGTGSPKKGWKRFAGILFGLSAGICFTVSNLIVKILSDFHPVNLSFWRYLGYLIPILPYLFYMGICKRVNVFSSLSFGTEEERNTVSSCGIFRLKLVHKNTLKLLIGTCACGIPIFIFRFYSLQYLTIADATVITFSGPLFTIVFGHFFLKEKCGFVTIPISLFTLLGVIVISRPTFLTGKSKMDTDVLIGTAFAFSSMLLGAVYFIIMRQLRLVHFSVVSLASGVIGLFETGALVWGMNVFKVPEGTKEILLMSALGLLALVGSSCIVFALKFEEAGTVSVVRMADVLYSFLFQFIFLNVVPDVYSIIGAAIVVSGVSLITFRKVLSTLPEEHSLTKVFRCLLL